jgi:hypothetical protein
LTPLWGRGIVAVVTGDTSLWLTGRVVGATPALLSVYPYILQDRAGSCKSATRVYNSIIEKNPLRKGENVPTPREFEDWYTAREVAIRAGQSPQWIKRLCEQRRLRASRTKLGWLIDPADAERYVHEHGARDER